MSNRLGKRGPSSRLTAALAGLAMVCMAAPVTAAEPTWRSVSPENLVFVELQEGRVVIELAPAFAPKTVAQFRRLVGATG